MHVNVHIATYDATVLVTFNIANDDIYHTLRLTKDGLAKWVKRRKSEKLCSNHPYSPEALQFVTRIQINYKTFTKMATLSSNSQSTCHGF